MTSLHEQYSSLVSLATLHILEKVNLDQWVMTDQQTHAFYREYAMSRQRATVRSQPKPPLPTISKPPEPAPTIKPQPKKAEPKAVVPRQQVSPQPTAIEDFQDIRQAITKVRPGFNPVDTIPDDAKARKINKKSNQTKRKPMVLMLTTEGPATHQDFLQKVTEAIHQQLMFAKMITTADLGRPGAIERLLAASHIRLIVATDNALRAQTDFYRHYQESVQEGRGFVGKIPVLRLRPIHDYLQHPKQKATLWQQLQKLLSVKS